MEYLITLDLGTTSVKTSLFNQHLDCVSSYTEEYQLITDESTIVELPPETYWTACANGILHVTGQGTLLAPETLADSNSIAEQLPHSNLDVSKIKSISISTQGETLIPVDAEGKALANAIVWLDARATKEAEQLKELICSDDFFKTTGLPEIGSASPICKLMWIKNNLPDVYDKTDKFLLLEDYIILKLTGQFVTEPTNMSSTGYLNTRDNEIWTDCLLAAGIDPKKIPQLVPAGTIVGNIKPEAAEATGLSINTVVNTGANDQICSAIGTGNIKPGSITETTGTALAVVSTTDSLPEQNLYNVTFSRHINDKFIMIAYSQTSGIIYKWFKDNFCEDNLVDNKTGPSCPYARLNELARIIPRGSDGLLLLPYFAGKLSPDYNENAKGVFYGLELGHTKGHFVRAIMEGIACMLRENMEIAYALCGETDCVISTGGAAKSPLWSQIKADMTNKSVHTAFNEGSSLGAAILGAVCNGWFQSIEEACDASIKIAKNYQPENEAVLIYQSVYQRYLQLYECLAPLFGTAQ